MAGLNKTNHCSYILDALVPQIHQMQTSTFDLFFKMNDSLDVRMMITTEAKYFKGNFYPWGVYDKTLETIYSSILLPEKNTLSLLSDPIC